MKKKGHGRAPHKSSGARKKKHIKEEPSNVSEEAQQKVGIEEENGSECGELVKALKCWTISTTGTESDLPESCIENLPDELLRNIFNRLFAKQLSQMRSVCKPWKSLLSEPSFVKSHLNLFIHTRLDDKILMAFNSSICPCLSRQHTILHHPSPSPQHTTRLPPVNPNSGYITTNFKVIGAVNGLLCSSFDDNSNIQIRNLSLSAFSTLPSSCAPSHRFSQDFLRFGFDPQTEDYKVVKITGIADIMKTLSATKGRIQFPYSIKKWLQVQVYSMRKGVWEFITSRVPSHLKILIDTDQLCVDGHGGRLHWLACSSKRGKTDFNSIATFDLSSHAFGEIRFPDSSTLNHHNYMNVIGVLTGKLCVLLRGDHGAHEVWVMEGSWVKRHAFSLSPAVYVFPPFGFTYHNELLLLHEDGYLVLYDPSANKTKCFNQFCCRQRLRPNKIVEVVDSLVWVGPAQPQPQVVGA